MKDGLFKTFLNILLILLFILAIFYDVALSNINFPFLTTFIFLIFIIIRFLKPIFR